MATALLEVVGIYFDKTIDIPDEGVENVLALMDLAKEQFPGVDFSLQPSGSMAAIEYTHPEDFRSRSGKPRPAGMYRIGEDRSDPSNPVAWQYYLNEERDGARISRTFGGNFKLPGSSEKVVPNNEVIWRCVRIIIRTPDELVS